MGFYKALFDIASFMTNMQAFVTFVTRLHHYINCEDKISCEISNFLEPLLLIMTDKKSFKEVKSFFMWHCIKKR